MRDHLNRARQALRNNPCGIDEALSAIDQAEAALDALRKALSAKDRAESELARLRTYARQTRGMKNDANRHATRLTDALTTIKEVLD